MNRRKVNQGCLARREARTYNTPMIATAEIEQMSLAERMEAMELLWRSISSKPGTVVSPAWHGEILQKRLARIEAGKASSSPSLNSRNVSASTADEASRHPRGGGRGHRSGARL